MIVSEVSDALDPDPASRAHAESGELEVARKVLAGITLQGLSEYTGNPTLPAPKYDYAAPQFVDPELLTEGRAAFH